MYYYRCQRCNRVFKHEIPYLVCTSCNYTDNTATAFIKYVKGAK